MKKTILLVLSGIILAGCGPSITIRHDADGGQTVETRSGWGW